MRTEADRAVLRSGTSLPPHPPTLMLYSTLFHMLPMLPLTSRHRRFALAVWLDSGGRGRYDILCAQPIATLVTHGTYTEITMQLVCNV